MYMEKWMADYCRRMNAAFSGRIRFIGLQGSRARGENDENSDIDVVCVLDELRPQDICAYRSALDGIERRNLVCGFLSGWEELLSWEASDLFQFYFDTIPFSGSLDVLMEKIDSDALERAVRIGAGNIYHGCVHNMVHQRDDEVLKALGKSAGFVLQALHYLRSGEYVRRMRDLPAVLNDADRCIAQLVLDLRDGKPVEFDRMSVMLFDWAQALLQKQHACLKT